MSNLAETQVLYRERVSPKWTSFIPLVLILPTFWLTFVPINVLLGVSIGLFLTVLVAWMMLANAPVITVTNAEISVGKATMPINFVGNVIEIGENEAFAEKGPKLDARAYLALQASRTGLVKIELSDPADPTPYWLVSTGEPEKFLDALKRAKN